MSEMSYLEKLLDGVEVEWVTLGSMADIGTGSSNRQDESENGIYPFYVRSKNILKSDTFEFDEVAIVIPGEGGIGDIFHYVEGKYALHQRAYRIRITTNAVDTKFLYYFMSSSFKQYILTKSVGATAISIRKPMLEGFKVPIPSPNNPEKSLAIQSEIVRILDKFTALTAELTAELTARKKQYNYYRDQLLSFEEGDVAWKTLGEISRKISSGGTPKTGVTEYYDGTIPWLRTQEVDFREIWDTEIKITEEGLKTSSAKWIPKDCIIIAMYGATVGKIGINKIPMTTNQACANIQLDEEIVHYRYVFHFLCSQYAYIKSLGTGSQTNINAQIVKNIKIPVPFAENPEKSLNEQLRIVNILDKFDTLTNSITEGLPREIELRQKQYEYYRDLLFSFPKPDSVTN
ncbi:TPA: restriction endonuclease subunit S [Escherichia coli]|nr:restriction endonuclease subunit S [Escherichia coli]